MDKPIPPFYCCYLLRSTVRHASLYVGSTPVMPRRLNQHNGKVKGGAKRTALNSLRPWEVACLVHGFPSKTAALQFEWAWQNAHLTRHIPVDERFNPDCRISPRSGKVRKNGRTRPRFSLSDKIFHLHTLLRTKSFRRWPLCVRFFSEDAHRTWLAWDQRFNDKIRPGVSVLTDFVKHSEYEADGAGSFQVPNAIKDLDTGYLPLKPYLEKTRSNGDQSARPSCAACGSQIAQEDSRHLVCPHCLARSHVTCLANHFSSNQADSVLPIDGRCPKCHSVIQWDVMVKEMSLRLRGEKEVEKLFRERKRKKVDSAKDSEPGKDGDGDLKEDELDDDWVFQVYDDEVDQNLVGSSAEADADIDESPPQRRWKAMANLEHSFIESEDGWDDIVFLD